MNLARPFVDRIHYWFLILCLIATIGNAASARDTPAPPCAGSPIPAYPLEPDVPIIDLWLDQRDLESWRPPACLDWQDQPATVLIAVAGRFQHGGPVDELLARLGAASQYTSISYWSWSRQRWRSLFEKSVALSAPVASAERPDFMLEELRRGKQILILQDESGPVGQVIQRVSIVDRTDDKIVIAATNVTPARMALLTLFEAGGSDMRLWIERAAEDRWRYYSLTRFSGSAMLARPALERSYANRAEAIFRYLTGTAHPQRTD